MKTTNRPIALVDLSERCLYAPGDGPLTQEMVDSIWSCLPASGTAYVRNGMLYVEPFDGDRMCCGQVADGVTDVSSAAVASVRARMAKFHRQCAINGDWLMGR